MAKDLLPDGRGGQGSPQSPRAYHPDDRDLAILALLRDDGRITAAEIARHLHLGESTVHDRLQRLRDAGYIRGYHADIDYERLGLGVAAYVILKGPQTKEMSDRIGEILRQLPEVQALTWVTGDFDALLLVRTRTTAHLEDVLFKINDVGRTFGQIHSSTAVILSETFRKAGVEFESIPEQAGEGPNPLVLRRA